MTTRSAPARRSSNPSSSATRSNPGRSRASSSVRTPYPTPPAAPAPGSSSRPVVPVAAPEHARPGRERGVEAGDGGRVGALLRAVDRGGAGRAEQRVVDVARHLDGEAVRDGEAREVDLGDLGEPPTPDAGRAGRRRRRCAARRRGPARGPRRRRWRRCRRGRSRSGGRRRRGRRAAPRRARAWSRPRRAGRRRGGAPGRRRRPARRRPWPRSAPTRCRRGARWGRSRGQGRRANPAATAASTVPSPPSAMGQSSASMPAGREAPGDRRGHLVRPERALELVRSHEDAHTAERAGPRSVASRASDSAWSDAHSPRGRRRVTR